MFEYCTWLTNAAGDKQGSLSLWSHSMAISLTLSALYSSQILIQWESSCIAEQRKPSPATNGSNPEESAVYPQRVCECPLLFFLREAGHRLGEVGACSFLHLLHVHLVQ